MKTLLKFVLNITVYVVVLFFMFEVWPKIWFDVQYSSEISSKLALSKKSVIIFDNFIVEDSDDECNSYENHSSHGDVVSSIFKSLTDPSQYSLFELEYTDTSGYQELFFLANELLESGQEVYINISFAPKSGLASQIFSKQLVELSNNEHVQISVAAGNNDFTRIQAESLVKKIYDKIEFNAVDFEDCMYSSISADASHLRSLIASTNEKKISDLFHKKYLSAFVFHVGHTFGILDSRNDSVREFLKTYLVASLKKFNIPSDNEELNSKLLDLYINNLNPFLFSALIQQYNTDIHIVSAVLPYDLLDNSPLGANNVGYEAALIQMKKNSDSGKVFPFEHYLDCPIDGLVTSKDRALGLYFVFNTDGTEVTPILGSSIASPAFLAQLFNQRL